MGHKVNIKLILVISLYLYYTFTFRNTFYDNILCCTVYNDIYTAAFKLNSHESMNNTTNASKN